VSVHDTSEAALPTSHDPDVAEVLAVDELLQRLEALAPLQARIVELRFFVGLSVEETASAIGKAPRTVKREWQLARAWLYRELRTPRP
jgi:DNA-directed RNA polymerase specialized sigma24 family protein